MESATTCFLEPSFLLCIEALGDRGKGQGPGGKAEGLPPELAPHCQEQRSLGTWQ